MFEEAQLYAPVTRGDDGGVTVHLGTNHPGAVDPEYRARRNALAALALEWQPGTPPPIADYTEDEHEVWRIVCAELHGLHERLACAVYLEGKQRLGCPRPGSRSSPRSTSCSVR
jgi:phenylalanine-4-hydroxylase